MIDNSKEGRAPAPKCRVNKHGEVVLTLTVEQAQRLRALWGNTTASEDYVPWRVLDDCVKNLPGYFRLGIETGAFNTSAANRY